MIETLFDFDISSPAVKINLDDIKAARVNIQNIAVRTSLRKAAAQINPRDTQLYFKFENEQLTGSFKLRGAYNKMLSLSPDERRRGVVASSAGNHAQGVALAAKLLGIQANIVMPETAPIVKIEATQNYGAKVILSGEAYDDAYQHAHKLEKENGYVFVHPYEDEKIIAGQGTIGLEIFEDLNDLDSVIVPIGGGGLISGIAFALKSLRREVRVNGVDSNPPPNMKRMFENQRLEPISKRVSTIADGIAVKTPSEKMKNILQKYVDEIVEVDDDQIAQAMVLLLNYSKTVVEGSGAAGLAAVLGHSLKLGKKSCIVLGGGNVDLNIMTKVIERGQRRNHHVARFAVVVDDLPGSLLKVSTVLANARANVLEVYHDRVSPEVGLRETRIDLLVETSSEAHAAKISDSLKEAGFRFYR